MSARPDHLIERAARRLPRQELWEQAADTAAPGHPAPYDRSPDAASPAATVLPLPECLGTAEPVDLAAMQRAGMIVFGAQRSRAIEEWVVVASTLLRQQKGANVSSMGNSLMVTSSRVAEGKSFCSINLAATIAQIRHGPLLLIDLDSKPQCLSAVLGLGDRPGMWDLLAGPGPDLTRFIVPTVVPNLHILPIGGRTASGRRPENQLPIAALQALGRQLPEWLLVLDTAPCLSTSDAATLAPMVGQIAMIVEAQRTQKSDIEAALGLLEPCETVTFVLNKAQAQMPGHFGADYYGYHGTGD